MRFTTVILAVALMASTAFAGNCGEGNVGWCMGSSTCRSEGGRRISGHCEPIGVQAHIGSGGGSGEDWAIPKYSCDMDNLKHHLAVS
ncbi:hypothetical protein BGW42_002455 [Actinomortierella wolfii]|nr:hypothetical protein BGW42_002455 [Actinomortierella wolfii]